VRYVLHACVLVAPVNPGPRLRGVDPLSDVLRVLQLSGAILFRARLRAPWCFAIPDATEMAHVLLPGAARLVRFHVMVEGECFVAVEGETVRLGPADVIVLPRGGAHVMCSEPDLPAIPVLSVLPELGTGTLPTLDCPGRGASVTLLCGFLGCDEPIFDPLLTALPPVVVDRRDRGASGTWLDAMLDYVLHESDSDPLPGGYTMQTRLVELMFLDVLRRHIAALPSDQKGWLAALRDPLVGRAVSELHADPARAWSLAALAKRVGLSRTMLAQRFRRVAGTTPMKYLADWRLQLASSLLKAEELSIAAAAARVGYQSEAAFNRAFKRRVGEPPAQWQKRQSRLARERAAEGGRQPSRQRVAQEAR
jgi:AraC family transcriptional regulator, alkane utilization regulator